MFSSYRRYIECLFLLAKEASGYILYTIPCLHLTLFAYGVMERPAAARIPLPPPLLLSLLRLLFVLRHCHLVRHCGVDADGLDGSDERRGTDLRTMLTIIHGKVSSGRHEKGALGSSL